MIEFGRVAGSYGVRGLMKVVVDDPELLAAQPDWWIGGEQRKVEETKIHSGKLLAKLAGVESPEQAKTYKGKAISIPRPEPGEGRYYWDDLIGLEVVNSQGQVLGVVKGMFSNGAHDVAELAGERRTIERLQSEVGDIRALLERQQRAANVEGLYGG